MGAPDDFSMWEEEVGGDGLSDSDGNKGVVVIAVFLVASSGILITLGLPLLGISALIVLALIAFLWRVGL